MYQFLFLQSTHIPVTRKISYSEFCKSGRKSNLQLFILSVLIKYPNGLSCRDLSEIGGVFNCSMTAPLKSLLDDRKIVIAGVKRSSVSNRKVQVYSLPQKATI